MKMMRMLTNIFIVFGVLIFLIGIFFVGDLPNNLSMKDLIYIIIFIVVMGFCIWVDKIEGRISYLEMRVMELEQEKHNKFRGDAY